MGVGGRQVSWKHASPLSLENREPLPSWVCVIPHSQKMSQTCLSPPDLNPGTACPLDPSLHLQRPASGLPVFSSWAESKCLQYKMQAWCVDLVISIVQKCLCMKNKQMPECTTSSSWHRMKGAGQPSDYGTGHCMALGCVFRWWTGPCWSADTGSW